MRNDAGAHGTHRLIKNLYRAKITISERVPYFERSDERIFEKNIGAGV